MDARRLVRAQLRARKTQKEGWPLKPHSSQRQRAEAGCHRLPRRMAKRTSVRAEPCTRDKMGVPGFRAASGRLKRKSAVRQNGAIKTGADNGAHGRASRAPTPQAKAFGRIPKNRPLGGFLDGIPPHRFEPRSVLENENSRDACLGCKISGADNGARTRDPHLGKVVLYQLSHVRKYGGENRIRTGGEGFAGPCLTTWPSRHYQKKPARKRASNELERTTGLEPATPTLARWCSTN